MLSFQCPVCKADVTQPEHPYAENEDAVPAEHPESRGAADERTPLLPREQRTIESDQESAPAYVNETETER